MHGAMFMAFCRMLLAYSAVAALLGGLACWYVMAA